MKKGFDALAIAAHLRLFSCVELMGLVCGQQSFTAAELVSVLVFEQFPTNSPTPGKFAQHRARASSATANNLSFHAAGATGFFRSVVRKLNSDQCRRFLLFVTAQSALPHTGQHIVVR